MDTRTRNTAYWANRNEKTINERYGSHRLSIRYFANDNHAQVTMYDDAELRFPLMWSYMMTDAEANSALELFKVIGYFDMVKTA